MIEWIIEHSIRNRYLVMILAAAVTVWAIYAVLNTPVDAIPDLSENQVIVFTDWMGRSPREIEDQITYPLSLKLQGLAGVKAVRSSSEFNFSMITIIFEDNIDFYFARQRVTEKLTLRPAPSCPPGVVPYLAPDATALGQIFWYTLEGGNPRPGPRYGPCRSSTSAPQLNSVPGVAEVATVGGMPREYQIDVDPNALRAYGVTLGELYEAVARSNMSVGGGVIQKNNAEYLLRSIGWIKDSRDIENTVVKEVKGTPIYVEQVAKVQLGTQFRRSIFEKDGNEVGRRRRHDALWRKPPGRHPAHQGQGSGAATGPAARRPHRAGLRPHPSHPRSHRIVDEMSCCMKSSSPAWRSCSSSCTSAASSSSASRCPCRCCSRSS